MLKLIVALLAIEKIGNSGGDTLAKRPVFMIANVVPFYNEVNTEFTFFNGFSEKQKKKSINSLHEAFLEDHPSSRVLEISSKSEDPLGVQLSAFNLVIQTKRKKSYSVESAFQSSKVFENGGPYRDILEMNSKEAKKDTRLKSSGRLLYFDFFGRRFELSPATFFYSWLYINTLSTHINLSNELMNFNAFTDIVFNPEKSINCQTRSAAVYVSLKKNGLLEKALESKENFLKIVYGEDNDISICCEQLSFWDRL